MATRIASTSRKTLLWLWPAVVLVNGLLAYILIQLGKNSQAAQSNAKEYPMIVFAVPMGGYLLIWAIRETIRWVRFGETFFGSSTKTFVLGEPLSGEISFSGKTRSSMARPYCLALSCRQRRGRSPDLIVWQDSHLVEALPDGSLPVNFVLSPEGKETAFPDQINGVRWRLEAKDTTDSFASFAAEYEILVER